MKVLLVGLGNIGLGLIVPVFQNAGYEVVGTDASKERLSDLKDGYFIRTPKQTPSYIYPRKIEVIPMEQVKNDFDLVVTSVGRGNLEKVAMWYKEKNFSAPVLMAENLPEPVNLFPKQIPIVVDRICPRVLRIENFLSVKAEDYYSIITLRGPLTEALSVDKNIGLINSVEGVEIERKEKLFTVNTSHIIAAIYGKNLGFSLVEEAIKNKEIQEKIQLVLIEVGRWLGFGDIEAEIRTQKIIERFSAPLFDSIDRILGKKDRKLGNPYLDIPLRELTFLGLNAPVLREARELYSKLD